MKSLRFLDRRVGFSLGAVSLLLGTLAPAVVPAFASADNQITTRSIQMGTSAQSATGVKYTVTFTPVTTLTAGGGGDIVIWFCQNTPLVGSSCTAPTGMSLAGVNVVGVGSEAPDTTGSYVAKGANYIVIKAAALTGGSPYSVVLDGVTNPDGSNLTNGTFYGRVETFANTTDGQAAGGDAGHGGTSTGTVVTNIKDDGSVAMAVSATIGVTAAVLESMTFCVFGDPNNNTATPTQGSADASSYLGTLTTSANGPGLGCVDNSTTNGGHSNGAPNPSTQLGQVNSGVSALDTGHISYAVDWAQLSTNASKGAIVFLKTGNQCVGLHRTSQSSPTTCDIPSFGATAGNTSTAAGTAGFGLSFGAASSAGTGSSGSVDINTNYDHSTGSYAMLGSGASTSSGQANSAENSLVQDTTSDYGGFVFGTEGAPIASMDVPFALAATVGNNTPAGSYKADLSLIAVGTF